jgi:hypothetical protein
MTIKALCLALGLLVLLPTLAGCGFPRCGVMWPCPK